MVLLLGRRSYVDRDSLMPGSIAFRIASDVSNSRGTGYLAGRSRELM
jgi:hypothetical protein